MRGLRLILSLPVVALSLGFALASAFTGAVAMMLRDVAVAIRAKEYPPASWAEKPRDVDLPSEHHPDPWIREQIKSWRNP